MGSQAHMVAVSQGSLLGSQIVVQQSPGNTRVITPQQVIAGKSGNIPAAFKCQILAQPSSKACRERFTSASVTISFIKKLHIKYNLVLVLPLVSLV